MTGEDLKKRREELGLSITEVSLVTKISLRVLHAIEAMDKAQLPAEIFLKGLLKSYALHLKLDAESTTKNYLLTLNPPPPKPVEPALDPAAPVNSATADKASIEKPKEKQATKEQSEAVQNSPTAPTSVSQKTIWISAGAVIVLAVLIFAGRMMVHNENNVAVKEEKPVETPVEHKPVEAAAVQPVTPQPVETPAEEAAKPVEHPMETNQANNSSLLPIIQAHDQEKPVENQKVALPHPAPAQVPTPIPGTAVVQEEVKKEPAAVKPEPIKVETPAITQAPKVEEKPKTEEKPKVEKVAEKPKEEKPIEKPADKPAEVKPEATATAAGPKSKELILEALDKVNIVIKKGSKQYKVSLQPDEIHTVHYSDTIEVEVSDGGAVNLIQNGHDNGVAGDLGKPKKMSL